MGVLARGHHGGAVLDVSEFGVASPVDTTSDGAFEPARGTIHGFKEVGSVLFNQDVTEPVEVGFDAAVHRRAVAWAMIVG